ncbi:MAG TPA: BON domain-containing protein [Arenimonas sp.]|uniref:BON domain-containing protein n=1 Tax=Arenimonas sp. TaxID=1872635 RepID=UPI002D7E4D9C|nr:BON domain-containing protein [Arenimonas sp.]HEU0153311.1 BON domain-containing protein [Arenimonas sp.]
MLNPTIKTKRTVLAAALAALVAPGLALADGMDMSGWNAETKDAYREGQIWGTYVTNPALDALDLQVDVEGDRATLTGDVESIIQKRLAERIALRADGIASVKNELRIDPELVVTVIEPVPGYATYVADATLEAMVDSKLLWNQYTDGLDINVMTNAGVVTLTGQADTPHSRALAGRLAATTPGTTLVNNQLTLDPDQKGQVATAEAADGDDALSDTRIAAKTNATLLWTEGVQGTDIDVEAKDGVVTLEGTVESGYEKELAIEIAQGIRGVERVDASGLKLSPATDSLSQR